MSAQDGGRAGPGDRDPRSSHPYHMYDAIRAQPAVFARVAREAPQPAERFAEIASGCERLHLAGTGTSFHAAELGEHLLREAGVGASVRAWRAFDFALYGPDLSPADAVIVVSHRGTKRYSRAALARARRAAAPTALITGEDGGDDADADVVFRTVPGERSSAHTVSFTGSVAALAALASRFGGVADDLPERSVPAALEAALGLEDRMDAMARAHAGRRRIWLAGGGPAATAAREIALKIKETSYLQAEGMATETLLHGPFQCAEAEDLFVLVAPSGPGQARTRELADAVRAIGASLLVVGDETAETVAGADAPCITVPTLPEPLGALACIVALQLFTYHLALVRGTDPDGFRLEDPRFARASAAVEL